MGGNFRIPKICFAMYVWREKDPLIDALAHLRAAYPAADVLVHADGDRKNYDAYRDICREFSAEFGHGMRLRPHPHGGEWLDRLLTWMATKDADWYIKLDPDTRVLRPLTFFPDADLFGLWRMVADFRRHPPTYYRFLTSAFIAMNGHALRQLTDSRELCAEKYRDSFYSFPAESAEEEPLSRGSFILNDAAEVLGLRRAAESHPEIHLRWRENVPPILWERYSVVNVESRPRPEFRPAA